jgi:rhomboid family GlyGly-CTERM serine protease
VVRQSTEPVKSGLPRQLLLAAASCVAVYLSPGLSDLLVYDRQAILAGDLWRLVTGHLVHFSPAHLFFNLLGFVTAGLIVWRRGYSRFWILCAISSLAISVALLLDPDVTSFGGISGLVNAAVVFAAIRGIGERGRWRWFSAAILILTVVNSALEAMTGRPTFAIPGDQSFVPVPLSHVIGGLTGAIMSLEPWRLPKRRRCHSECGNIMW